MSTQRGRKRRRTKASKKAAKAAAYKRWYEKTKARRALQKKQWLVEYRTKNPVKSKLSALKSRAKRGGMPFDLDAEWLTSKLNAGVSELTGTPLDKRPGFNNPRGWSVDRIDCNKGYTKSNCRVVTLHENLALSQFGEAELLRLAESLVMRKSPSTKNNQRLRTT